MSEQIYSFAPVIPSGTAESSPVTIDLTMPVRSIDTIEIRVPPGPSGLMGFALTMDGVTVIPTQQGTYIVADNQSMTWNMNGLPTSGAWKLTGYNTDVFDHSVYVRFLVSQVSVSQPTSTVGSATLAQLSSA